MHKLALAAMLMAMVALTGGAQAEDAKSASPQRSAMFTAAEFAQITGALRGEVKTIHPLDTPAAQEEAKPVIANIYVSAVADYGSGRWTVWANGQRIMPGRQAPGFQIVSVRDDRVEIKVEGDTPARFTLRPHQTWLSESNDVVEGIVP